MVSEVEETARNHTEFDEDCMESVVKPLRCSAAKHPVRNDIHVVRVVCSSTGIDSVLIHNSSKKKIIAITLLADFTVFAFLGVGEDGCFRSLLFCFMVGLVIQPSFFCCDEAL
ncbi:hypothetical protein TNCV_1013701 [Trichonephila clavipes]|uniref:Uncharacterized protein n=1 Tax=Trichonephila clavipes TaxID=2585209 RepID=A0A8X6VXR5_TRICX|nr:hypothetical protein TNCV_1013701 [Trichonephila clavipes]